MLLTLPGLVLRQTTIQWSVHLMVVNYEGAQNDSAPTQRVTMRNLKNQSK